MADRTRALRASRASGAFARRTGRDRGFTLLEVVVSIAILAAVLTMSYRILTNVLMTERHVARMAAPEKVGVGILALVQKDLLGVTYRGLGERVFLVYDNGDSPLAQDELQCITTRAPIQPHTLGGQLESGGSDAFGDERFHGLTAITYKLQETPGARGVYTLFRIENAEIDALDPFNPARGGSMAYEVYDKVKSFSVECFDGREWVLVWDSQVRLQEEAALAEEEALGAASSNIERVAGAVPGSAGTDPLEDPAAASAMILPPAAVPLAVRISIVILVGDEKGVYTDETGFGEFKEFTYTAMVVLPTAVRIPISSDEELQELEDLSGMGGADGAAEDGGTSFMGGFTENSGRGGRGGTGGPGGRGGESGSGARTMDPNALRQQSDAARQSRGR